MKKISGVIATEKRSSDRISDYALSTDEGMKELQTLNIIRELMEALDAERIVYCHWKSNAMLDRSATGENDLDLLINRSDVSRFTTILYRSGFREARVPTVQQLPGVLSYYGYDREADRFVHIHAHYQLIMGHDMTKNYRLPIERIYLESVIRDGLFNIPAPEFELIIFVIRMVLKHSTWEAILGLQGTMSSTEREELEYLQTRADQERIYEILRHDLKLLDESLFNDCMRSLQIDCSVWFRIKAGQQLQSRLRAHARRSELLDSFLKLGRRGILAIRRHFLRQLPKKRLASGGAIVALVGGDGAGKSTTIDELYAWFSKDFTVIKVHMGKPALSWATVAVRAILKIGQTLGFYPYTRSPIHHISDPNSDVFPGYPWLLREIFTARDRYLTYVKARRFANNGGIVVCDRFPLPQVKLMDGLRSHLMINDGKTNRLIEILVRAGEKYYQQISLPELLILLKVEPEIAVQRKNDEDAAAVRARSTEIWELDWKETPAHVIDASRPQAEVFSEVKALIWSEL